LQSQGALITPPGKNEYDLDAFDRVNAMASMDPSEMIGGEEMMGADRPDAFASQRSMFEGLLAKDDDCGNDDCIVPPEGEEPQ
jgi:hypothetical protein